MADRVIDTVTKTRVRFDVGAHIYGSVVDLDSPDYVRFQRFQEARFARLQSTRSDPNPDLSPKYTEATHTSASEIVPIIVRRRADPIARAAVYDDEDEMVAIARLELPGATLIESMIELRAGSVAQVALATGRAAEIGGFAALEGISRLDLIDAVDAIVGVVIELARQRHLDWLWIFPRAAFMSLLCAGIPDALPPYHFTLSPDIVGWLPESAQLTAFRAMRLRGFLDMPLIYQIETETYADDLRERMACYDQRAQLGEGAGLLLGRAMIAAQRTLRQEVELIYPPSSRGENRTGADGAGERSASSEVVFLPEGLSNDLPLATYLRRVLSEGGAPAQAYKELSYSLLEIQPGQRILDVGCGAGVDLPALAQITGTGGAVVGLEINATLVREAQRLVADRQDTAKASMLVFHGDAQQMTIPNAEFDRARTDRALQHFPQPRQALAEIWRVLKPGGILTLVEPDWGSIVVAPGSATGDGDEIISKALDWCRRHLAHPLIGRNLHGLLRQMPPESWQTIKVVAAPFTFTEWTAMDAVLLLSRAAAALQQEAPDQAAEVEAWLRAVETASARGSFFGYIPMFFAVAVKSAAGRWPGV